MDTILSIARHYGRIRANGHEYTIVNKNGIDIFTISEMAVIEGRDKAIEAGEPCDLCRNDFIPFYRKLWRERKLKANNHL